MSKPLTAYDLYYEKYIKKGYSHLYSQISAEIDVERIQEESDLKKPVTVYVFGVGNCQYSGD